MPKSKLNTEQIIGVLKQVEAGPTVAEVAREIGVSHHTIYALRAKYGGMEVNETEELRLLREENQRLKKLVAELSLEKDMLKSVKQKTGTARGFPCSLARLPKMLMRSWCCIARNTTAEQRPNLALLGAWVGPP